MSFDSPLPPYNASDPNATFLASSCFDLLLIELVPMAYRLAHELDAQDKDGMAGYAPEQIAKDGSVAGSASTKATGTTRVGGGGAGAGGAVARPPGSGETVMDEDEERDAVFFRLESIGYRVGLGIVERFSANRPHFTDPLDAIKFLCKDIWTLVFRKQIDNLKTNHRGVFVLTDNQFRPFSRMSIVPGEVASTTQGGISQQAVKETLVVRAQPYLWLHVGLVRGALAAMGLNASVQAETEGLPRAVFQIKSLGGKA